MVMNRFPWVFLFCAMLLATVSLPGAKASECASREVETAYIIGAMNIRASSSTNSTVVASARAGDSFAVLESRRGQTWCWLRISRGWLAKTSRVQSTRPVQRVASSPVSPKPDPQTDIDNCCFVDRQCTTNKQWEDGYWAYQNKECATTVAPPVSSVAEPTSEAAAPVSTVAKSDVNNCCHIGWDCRTENDWIHGYNAYQSNQCENPGVVVIGSDHFKAVIFAALRLLKERSAYWYLYTVDGLDNIREQTGNRIYVTSRTGDVSWGSQGGYISSADIGAAAGVLVHEACHVHRRRAGLQSGGLEGERDCLQKEIQVLDLLGTSPGTRNWLQNILDNINDRAYQWWH